MKSKFNNIIPLLIAGFAISITIGCSPSKKEEIIEEPLSISLSETSLKMVVGDFTKLVVSNSKEDESLLITWSSSNDKIATVDQEGKIEAIYPGEAVISAAHDDILAACLITVSSDVFLPSLEFENEIKNEEFVPINSELNLNTYILFNSRKFYDAEINATISNSQIGTFSNGIFKASNTLSAQGDITLTASWRNFSSPTLTKKIHITTTSINSVYLNDGEIDSINLFSTAKVGEKSYPTMIETNVKCKESGVDKVPYEVVAINNYSRESMDIPCVEVEYNSSKQTIKVTALRAGSASLSVTFKKSDGQDYTKLFPISVDFPIYEYETPIDYFSILDGSYYDTSLDRFVTLNNLFLTGNKEIVRAYQGDNALTIKDNCLLGVTSYSFDSYDSVNVLLYNDKIGVKVTLYVYQKVITTANDLNSLYSSKVKNDTKEGYYVLAKDIDGTNEAFVMKANEFASSFDGVFDGQGHIIKNVSLKHNSINEEWGLFGYGLGGTIKNVAFYNCSANQSYTGFLAHHTDDGGTLNNVFLQVRITGNETNAASYGAFYSTYGFLLAKQVIINVPNILSGTNKGALGIHKLHTNSKDLYIVTPTVNGIGRNESNKSYIYQSEADNDTAFKGNKFVLYPSALMYPSFNDMNDAHNSYNDFDTSIWNLSKGIPVFNGLNYF